MLVFSFRDVDAMSGDYSLPDLIERIYANQLSLEAALMELTLHVERLGAQEVGANVRGRYRPLVKTPVTFGKAWQSLEPQIFN